MLCFVFDLVITLLGRGFSMKSPRFYFDFFIVALALTMTYLPTSAFDSIDDVRHQGGIHRRVCAPLREVPRFALLIRVLS